MSAEEFENWCRELRLPEGCRAMIARVRASPPARRVGNAAGNVCGFYPSAKMGQTIQFESHRNELAVIYEYEHDPEVLEYWDQPGKIRLIYEDRNGRRVGIMHTPDFLVLRREGVTWEECKLADELFALTKQSPNRYVKQKDDTWACPPGEEYAARLGLGYRLRSSSEINWTLQRNMIFLADYLRENTPPVTPEVAGLVLAKVRDEPGLSLADLLNRVEGVSRDMIHTMIATGAIHVDLRATPLTEPANVRLFRDLETATAHQIVESCDRPATHIVSSGLLALPGTNLLWDERTYTIVSVGASRVMLQPVEGGLVKLARANFENLLKTGEITVAHAMEATGTDSDLRELFARASQEEYAEANRRFLIVRPLLSATSLPDDLPLPAGGPCIRTVRRWIEAWRLAEATHGCGYVGLLPGWGRRGNRSRKLPQETLDAMDEAIKQEHETIRGKVTERVYGALVSECERQGLVVPSSIAFRKAIRLRPKHRKASARQGHRAAYQYEVRYLESSPTAPRHGERPFEICHIDHTQIDLEMVCSRTRVNLGRAWMTLLVDAFSRRVLAVFVTFDEPSYRSCMMVLRLCVQRHGRLPQNIVVDNGPEFNSVWFDCFLARHHIIKKKRPPAKARFGSVCERLFGTSNTQFIHNLAGNTKVTKNVRQVTKSVNPKEHACWNLGAFYEAFCAYVYQQYDTTDHPALGESPRVAFTRGLELGGERAHLYVPYDEGFRMLLLPSTPKGKAKVQPGNGVKINYNYYWTDEFRNPAVENTWVPIRYDPFDAGVAWAYVGKYDPLDAKAHDDRRWLRCTAWHWEAFRGRSEKELMLATTQLRKLRQRHSSRAVISARMLADFLTGVETQEALLPQRAKDAALSEVFAVIDGQPAPRPCADAPPPAPDLPGTEPATGNLLWDAATNPENLSDFEQA